MEAVRPLEPRRVEVAYSPDRMAAEILSEAYALLVDRDSLSRQETSFPTPAERSAIVFGELEEVVS